MSQDMQTPNSTDKPKFWNRKTKTIATAVCCAAVSAALCGIGLAIPHQNVEAEQQPSTDVEVEDQQDVTVFSLTDNSIIDMCKTASLDGQPVGVDSDVVASQGSSHVMITHKSSDDAPKTVDMAARRAAAMAHLLQGQEVAGGKTTDVTWVETSQDGSVRVAVTDATDSCPSGGSTAELITGSIGHVIADDVWASDGVHDNGYDQNGGKAPTAPDGTIIEPSKPAPEQNEQANQAVGSSTQTTQQSDGQHQDANNGSTNQSQVSPSGSNSGSDSQANSNQGSNGQQSANEGQSQPSQPSQPSRRWVAEKGHNEPIYSNKWVVDRAAYDEKVDTGRGKYVCSDGHVCYSEAEIDDYLQTHDVSYSVQTLYTTVHHDAVGHYEQVQTGSRYVVDVAGHWE